MLKINQDEQYLMRKFVKYFLSALVLVSSLDFLIYFTRTLEHTTHVITPWSVLDLSFFYLLQSSVVIWPIAALLASLVSIVQFGDVKLSWRQMTKSILLIGFLLASLQLSVNNIVIPKANQLRESIQQNGDRYYFDQAETEVFVHHFDYPQSAVTPSRFSFEEFKSGQAVQRIAARNAHYDNKTSQWVLEDYVIQTFDNNGVADIRTGGNHIEMDLAVHPENFQYGLMRNTMSSLDLYQLIQLPILRDKPYVVKNCQQHLYIRLLSPILLFCCCLLGLFLSKFQLFRQAIIPRF